MWIFKLLFKPSSTMDAISDKKGSIKYLFLLFFAYGLTSSLIKASTSPNRPPDLDILLIHITQVPLQILIFIPFSYVLFNYYALSRILIYVFEIFKLKISLLQAKKISLVILTPFFVCRISLILIANLNVYNHLINIALVALASLYSIYLLFLIANYKILNFKKAVLLTVTVIPSIVVSIIIYNFIIELIAQLY